MATTLQTWTPQAAVYPSSNPPQAAWTAGTNFPWMSLNFDQSTAEKVYFFGVVSQSYGGGNISAKVFWTATTTGDVVWGAKYLGRVDDEVFDSALSAQATVTDSVTAANDIMVATITLSSPTLAAGDFLIFELERVAANAADTLAGDAKFLGLTLEE